MLAEQKTVDYTNYTLFIVGVLKVQILEDASLYETLLMESLLVSQNFEGDSIASLMVGALEDRAERALTHRFLDFISVSNLVLDLNDILSVLSVKAMVQYHVFRTLNLLLLYFFLFCLQVSVIDNWVIRDFSLLIVGQILGETLKKFLRIHREMGCRHWLFRPIHEHTLATIYHVLVSHHDRT